MLTLRDAPCLLNTGAVTIAGNMRYAPAPPRPGAPEKNASIAAPRSLRNTKRETSSSESRSRSRSDRTTSFQALENVPQPSATASGHITVSTDGSTRSLTAFVRIRASNAATLAGKFLITFDQPSATPRHRSLSKADANPKTAR